MTDPDIVDAEVVPSVEEHRASVGRARGHLEKAADEIVWQVANRSWAALGYRDWDHMREEEYGGIAVIVPRADRPELVAKLRREGLTQQSIASTVGASQMQVSRDLNKQMFNEDAAPVVNARGQARPAAYAPREPAPRVEPAQADRSTGEVLDNYPSEQSRRVTLSQFTGEEDGDESAPAALVTPPPAPVRPPKRDPFNITELKSEAPPQAPPKQRLADLPQEHWDKVNARQRVENMATALHTISLLKADAERARIHSAWATNPEAAGAFGGPLHTPDTIRSLADLMRLYADEMEGRNAR